MRRYSIGAVLLDREDPSHLIARLRTPLLQADANERDPLTRNIAYILGWQSADLYLEAFIQTVNRVGYENVDGAAMKETLEGIDFSPLGLVTLNFQDGNRDAKLNRIAVMRYLGEDGGVAEPPDNPPVVQESESGPVLIPIAVPLMDFEETPDLRPGGADDPMGMGDE